MDLWAVRAAANGIGVERAASVVGAVSNAVALQGQDVRANRLAVRVRAGGLTWRDVDDAVGRGEVVRTWAMRGTLHMLAAVDLRWVLRVLGGYFRDRQRARRWQLGLDDASCERGTRQLEEILTSPLTRAEITERLDLPLAGQAAPYLLGFAALEGVICRGPERGDEATYVLVKDWVPASQDGQLALRYLQGYGPASPRDLAAWSGLPLTAARRAFQDVRDLLEPFDAECFVVRGHHAVEATQGRLLGHFDAFMLGYRERSIPAGYTRKVQSGGGFVLPVVSVGGRVLAGWRQRSVKDSLAVDVTPFTTISEQLISELTAEVADLGRFLERPISLSVASVAAPD